MCPISEQQKIFLFFRLQYLQKDEVDPSNAQDLSLNQKILFYPLHPIPTYLQKDELNCPGNAEDLSTTTPSQFNPTSAPEESTGTSSRPW
jgi:hypothetical protein